MTRTDMFPDELLTDIARHWVTVDFPHREFHLLSEDEQGRWKQDVGNVLNAMRVAGYQVVDQARRPLLYSNEDLA